MCVCVILFPPLVNQEGIISFVVVSAGIIWSWQEYVSIISVLYLTITTRSESKLAFHLYWVPRWHSGKEKDLPAQAGDIRDAGSIPGLERSPGEGMATYSSILAWRSQWTEKPGELQSMGSQRVRHDWTHTHTHITHHLYKILVIRFCFKCLSGEHILYQVFSDTFWLVISNLI